MALGFLVSFYLVICVISIAGFLALYLVKSEKAKKVIFYSMSVWGIALAALQAVSMPMNWTGQRVVTMGTESHRHHPLSGPVHRHGHGLQRRKGKPPYRQTV